MDYSKELVKVAKELNKIDDKILKELANATDRNDHTGALIILYKKVLKDNEAIKALNAINVLHDYFGSMPTKLGDLRYNEFFKPAKAKLIKEFGEEEANRVWNSF